MVHPAVLAERSHLPGQGALPFLAEVGRDPGVEHDEGAVVRHGGNNAGQIGQQVAALETWGIRRGPDIGQCGPQALEAGGIVRPQTSQQPAGLVIRERVDRRKVQPDPLGHGGQAEVRQACEAVPHRALEGDSGVRHSGSKDRVAGIGPVGVGVVVEKEVEAGRSTEVEQGKRLVPGVLRSNVAEAGEKRGTTTDLVGLGRTGGDQSLELDATATAKVGEDRRDVTRRWRSGRGTLHEADRVVERGQRVSGAREQEVVHRRQQKQGAALGERSSTQECEHFFVVGHAAADGGVGDAAVTFDHGGEVTELLAQWFLDRHRD